MRFDGLSFARDSAMELGNSAEPVRSYPISCGKHFREALAAVVSVEESNATKGDRKTQEQVRRWESTLEG